MTISFWLKPDRSQGQIGPSWFEQAHLLMPPPTKEDFIKLIIIVELKLISDNQLNLLYTCSISLSLSSVNCSLFFSWIVWSWLKPCICPPWNQQIEYSSISNDFFAIRFHKNPNLFKSKGWAMRPTTCIKSSEKTFWQKDDLKFYFTYPEENFRRIPRRIFKWLPV